MILSSRGSGLDLNATAAKKQSRFTLVGDARKAASPAPTAAPLPPEILFGHSRTMQTVRSALEQVAPTNVPVLITGESGVGKEVLARYLHTRSNVSGGPFVRVNCPGLPGALLESELFGYEQGAFTGASHAKAGLVESASGGTLFLDSIDELELSLQSKLLQFLQDHQFTRLGGQDYLSADVRIVCAASRSLEEEIEAGQFRRDLLYRINVVTLQLPPLRERRDDIPELVDFLLDAFSTEFGRTPPPISPPVRQLIASHDWPGNIRQLENAIKRYVIMASEEAIFTDAIAESQAPHPVVGPSETLKEIARRALMEVERKAILESLFAHRWNRRKTAAALGISYRALLYKMEQTGLPAKKKRANIEDEVVQ